MMRFTRRCFNGGLLASFAAQAAARERSYADEFPDMLLRRLVNPLNALSEDWDKQRARISTPAQIDARNAEVRKRMLSMLGPWPERCPLEPRTVKAFDRNGYRVENVMFQSRPDFWVTG